MIAKSHSVSISSKISFLFVKSRIDRALSVIIRSIEGRVEEGCCLKFEEVGKNLGEEVERKLILCESLF